MSKGLMGVNRRRYTGIDFEQKWAVGAVLYDEEADDLVLVLGVVMPGEEVIALIEKQGEVKLINVVPPGTPGIVPWAYVGHIGGTLESW